MSNTLSFSACQQRDKSQKLDFHDVQWVNYQGDNDNGYFKGAQSRFAHIEKISFNFFKFVVCNPCQSSPSLVILVPLWFIIISLLFFFLIKLLFSGFLPFKGNFVCGQNNSKYHD